MKNALLLAVSLVLTLAVVEGAFRVREVVRESRVDVENQFIRATNVRRVFERATVDGEDLYVRTDLHWIPRWPRFQAEKDPDTFRVFCLGGSAAMGWPLAGEAAWPAWLERKLALLYPDRRIEVINAAGNTYASYRVKIVFDEVIEYEPDAIVVYSGNNEFLENAVYRPRHLDLAAGPADAGFVRSTALGRFVLGRLGLRRPPKRTIDVESYAARDMVANRLSFAFGRASALRSDPEQFATVVDHYVYNLESMVRAGRERGVPVVLATVPVNLRDWHPNASVHGVQDAADREAFQEAYRAGVEALEAGRPADAESALARAVRIDPAYAYAWYDLGLARLRLRRRREAKVAFQQALRNDAYPFRSLFDDQVRGVATREGAPLADLTGVLGERAEDGILGFDLLLDYVHPTTEGHEIIAQEVLETLAAHGHLPEGPALPLQAVRFDAPETELDWSALQGLYGQVLVMRQYEVIEAFGARLRRALVARTPGLSARERGWNDDAIERLDRSLRVVAPYRDLLRAERLGLLDERYTPEQAEAIFADYAALIREMEGDGISDAEFATYLPERTAR
ncbi:MAG: GDSL-type esterase/lipase family protein [Myxococcota bacterium]